MPCAPTASEPLAWLLQSDDCRLRLAKPFAGTPRSRPFLVGEGLSRAEIAGYHYLGCCPSSGNMVVDQDENLPRGIVVPVCKKTGARRRHLSLPGVQGAGAAGWGLGV